jgi:hypothetical protein
MDGLRAAHRFRATVGTAVLSGAAVLAAAAGALADETPPVFTDETYEEYVTEGALAESSATPAVWASQPGPNQARAAAPGGVQPRTARRTPASSPRGRTSAFVSTAASAAALAPSRVRLASTPDMFGDFFWRSGTITATDVLATTAPSTIVGRVDVPVAGGARGLKIGEQNKATPTDRVYYTYNHYHNAVRFRAAGSNPPLGTAFAAATDLSLDQVTLGFEKTWLDGLGSVEVRMPISAGYDFHFGSGDPAGIVAVEGGNAGNLSIIPKVLLYEDEFTDVSLGLGIETPTGSDANARVAFTHYRIKNEAVHLHPYFALMGACPDGSFAHGFAQLDIAANGNTVEFFAADRPPAAGVLGEYNEQTLLHVDFSLGQWLYRDLAAPLVTGVAAVAEWHYITALQDTDVVAAALPSAFPPGATFDLRNLSNRFDVVNVTAGVHAEFARDTTLRVGGVFPMQGGDNRFFDAEILAQFSHRF